MPAPRLRRRDFLKALGVAGLLPRAAWTLPKSQRGELVNDVHSQLNSTRVSRVVRVDSVELLQSTIATARREGKKLSIAGGRHSMGGQQFGTDTILLDMRGMNRVLRFDAQAGAIEAEAGIMWPALIDFYLKAQQGSANQWGIAHKQTGADRFTLGGSLAANAHGRGLTLAPLVTDVESFTLLDARGDFHRCSRTSNAELFRLVIGGYGLFGVMTSVVLRLKPRRKLSRLVEIILVEELMPAFEQRIRDGFLYGDFQFATDESSEDFLRRGVFSCYRPSRPDATIPDAQKELVEDDWRNLLYLAHADKRKAFDTYARYYLSTNGQIYWSDTHQLAIYPDGYHRWVDARTGSSVHSTEMITEIYVPRPDLGRFLAEVRKDFRDNRVNLIYGTIRLIERDTDTFMPWARESWACVVFNLHVPHTRDGMAHSSGAFRRLIDLGIAHGGSYFLTYHCWADRRQLLACYPQFPEFLRLKRYYDPKELFWSDWYAHYKRMFA